MSFDSSELIRNSIRSLDKELRVTPLQYTIQSGEQISNTTLDQLKSGQGFQIKETATEKYKASIHSMVKYDLLGKLAESTQLTRKTIAEILGGIQPAVFKQFKQNPEHFLAEASRLINEQKATIIIERLSYDAIAETHDSRHFHRWPKQAGFYQSQRKAQENIFTTM